MLKRLELLMRRDSFERDVNTYGAREEEKEKRTVTNVGDEAANAS